MEKTKQHSMTETTTPIKLKGITTEALKKIIPDFCFRVGIEHIPNDTSINYAAEILGTQFGHMTKDDLMEAATLFTAGKITGFEHFQKFTPAFLGRLMTAMEKRLKDEGRLISLYDASRQYGQTNNLTEKKDNDWMEYLLWLKYKFENGILEESTLFVPLPVYDYLVNLGYLERNDWHRFSTKASDSIAFKRKMKSPEFVTIGNVNAFGSSESEAKKLCILQFLKEKCKIAYPEKFSWNERQAYEEKYNMVAKIPTTANPLG